jgi:hypothetical protein
MTRLKVKIFKETFNRHFQNIWVKVNFKNILNNNKQVLINLIHVQDRLINGHSNIIKRLE